mmetsp:Transcript_65649/g.173225  ORF Transcript_65649/g.173225 Transcript_65649/m.173225 type:complete len:89 (+) Transcript_65649:1321-1587(+)
MGLSPTRACTAEAVASPNWARQAVGHNLVVCIHAPALPPQFWRIRRWRERLQRISSIQASIVTFHCMASLQPAGILFRRTLVLYCRPS